MDLLLVKPLGSLPQVLVLCVIFSACVSPQNCLQLANFFLFYTSYGIGNFLFHEHSKNEKTGLLFRDFIAKEKETNKNRKLTYISEILESSHSNFPHSIVRDCVSQLWMLEVCPDSW